MQENRSLESVRCRKIESPRWESNPHSMQILSMTNYGGEQANNLIPSIYNNCLLFATVPAAIATKGADAAPTAAS